MAQPLGENFKNCMRALDRLGPSLAVDIQRATAPERHGHASTYLQRAVQLGFATVRGNNHSRIYTAVPGWEKWIKMPKSLPVVPRYSKVPDRIPDRHELQAVWQ